MSDKTTPYAELGALLQSWRRSKFNSATAFCNHTKLSFPYRRYSAFERGEVLPTPENLKELAHILKVDVREALFMWSKVQMPSSLQECFSSDALNIIKAAKIPNKFIYLEGENEPYQIDTNNIPPDELDSAWVYGLAELEAFKKHPWLPDLFLWLQMSFPQEVTYEELGFNSINAFKTFKEDYLKPWLTYGHIISTDTTLKITLPYIHMPKTAQWDKFREESLVKLFNNSLQYLNAENIKNKTVHRTAVHKILTEDQYKDWIKKLAEIEMYFVNMPLINQAKESEKKTYTLLSLFTPKKIEIPKSILELCK